MRRILVVFMLLASSGCPEAFKDNGFDKVCWEGGLANHKEGCITELKWDKSRFPLSVWVDIEDNTYIPSIKKGYILWNEEVGPLFKFVNAVDKPAVHVRWGSVDKNAVMSVVHNGSVTTGPISAIHIVRQPGNLFEVYRWSAHEAGHVLGLAHDRNGLMASIWNYSGKIELFFPVMLIVS